MSLRRMPAAGGASELFDYLGPQGADGTCEFCLNRMVAADDGRLYWYDTADRTFFYRTGAAPFQRELLGADGTGAVSLYQPIFVFDGQIYWSSQGEIGRVAVSGGETELVPTVGYTDTFFPTAAGLAVANLFGEVRLIRASGCSDAGLHRDEIR